MNNCDCIKLDMEKLNINCNIKLIKILIQFISKLFKPFHFTKNLSNLTDNDIIIIVSWFGKFISFKKKQNITIHITKFDFNEQIIVLFQHINFGVDNNITVKLEATEWIKDEYINKYLTNLKVIDSSLFHLSIVL